MTTEKTTPDSVAGARTNQSAAQLTPVERPVTDALILVCEKCGRKITGHDGENPSVALQTELKATIKTRFGKGKMRAVSSSCMDICPQDAVAVGISWTDPAEGRDRFFTVDRNDVRPENRPAVIETIIAAVDAGPAKT